jgi:hypothetical protein
MLLLFSVTSVLRVLPASNEIKCFNTEGTEKFKSAERKMGPKWGINLGLNRLRKK